MITRKVPDTILVKGKCVELVTLARGLLCLMVSVDGPDLCPGPHAQARSFRSSCQKPETVLRLRSPQTDNGDISVSKSNPKRAIRADKDLRTGKRQAVTVPVVHDGVSPSPCKPWTGNWGLAMAGPAGWHSMPADRGRPPRAAATIGQGVSGDCKVNTAGICCNNSSSCPPSLALVRWESEERRGWGVGVGWGLTGGCGGVSCSAGTEAKCARWVWGDDNWHGHDLLYTCWCQPRGFVGHARPAALGSRAPLILDRCLT